MLVASQHTRLPSLLPRSPRSLIMLGLVQAPAQPHLRRRRRRPLQLRQGLTQQRQGQLVFAAPSDATAPNCAVSSALGVCSTCRSIRAIASSDFHSSTYSCANSICALRVLRLGRTDGLQRPGAPPRCARPADSGGPTPARPIRAPPHPHIRPKSVRRARRSARGASGQSATGARQANSGAASPATTCSNCAKAAADSRRA